MEATNYSWINLFTADNNTVSSFLWSYCSGYHENFSTHKLQPAVTESQSRWLHVVSLQRPQSTDERCPRSTHDKEHVVY